MHNEYIISRIRHLGTNVHHRIIVVQVYKVAGIIVDVRGSYFGDLLLVTHLELYFLRVRCIREPGSHTFTIFAHTHRLWSDIVQRPCVVWNSDH